jgi:hypothetical protein
MIRSARRLRAAFRLLTLAAVFFALGVGEASLSVARTLQCAPNQQIQVHDVHYRADGSGVIANVPNNDVLAMIQAGCGFPGGGVGGSSAGVSGDIQTGDGSGAFVALHPGTGIATWLANPTSANLAATLPDETGSGAAVFATSPALITPNLGVPSAADLTNATNIPAGQLTGTISVNRFNSGTNADATHFLRGDGIWAVPAGGGGGSPAGVNGDIQTNSSGSFGALTPGSGIATFLATPTSANLRAALTDEVGSGAAYFVGGALGTPASGTATNLTGLPLAGIAAISANSVAMNATGGSASPTAVALPACADSGGNHLNYSSGVFSCGTSSSGGGSPLTTTDGTNSVASTTTQTYDPKTFVVGGSAGSATIALTSVVGADKSATDYTIDTADSNTTIPVGAAHAYTLAQAGAAGFEAGWGVCLQNVSSSGNATISTTTSVFKGAGGATSFVLEGGGWACLTSKSGDWYTQVGHYIVPNANLATMAAHTYKGNNTGSTAVPSDLTATQLTAELNAVVGDSGAGGTKGLVPAPGAGDTAANKFLKANGTWATTPGGGTGCNTTGSSSQVLVDDGAGGCNSVSGAQADANTLAAPRVVLLSGTLTPTALSGNVNDYNPANLGTSLALRLDPNGADRTITGIQGGADGRILTITNIGSANNLILSNADAGSSAANRFAMDASVVLAPNAAFALRYDGTSSRWRSLSRTHQEVDYAVGWAAGVSPNKLIDFTAPRAMQVTKIVGTVGDAVGASAAITVYKAPSGTVCTSGTALHTGTFNANGTAATNQTLTFSGTVADLQLAAGDRVCLGTADGAAFIAGSGNGAVTVSARAL